jgi:hypothetical protein
MILQTGGRAVGATSTRSSPASRANRSASLVEVLPTFSSLSLIRKIGEMRICSLWRKFVEIPIPPKNRDYPIGQSERPNPQLTHGCNSGGPTPQIIGNQVESFNDKPLIFIAGIEE